MSEGKKATLYCLVFLMQPLLRLYGLGIGGTFADYALIIVVMYIILRRKKTILIINKGTDAAEFLPIMVCVMFNILFTFNTAFNFGNQIQYWIRYILYYFVLIYGVKNYYSVEKGYAAYRVLAIAATVFLFVQVFSNSFAGIYIPGQFGPWALTDITSQYDRYNIYANYNLFRPSSFFTEPAHYATFVSSFVLLTSLREVNKKSIILMLFCTAGILVSGSTTGMAITGVIWAYWGVRVLSKKNSVKYIFPIVILGLVGFYFVSKTNSFQIMMMRTFQTQNALNSRFEWLDTFKVMKGPTEWLFGLGNSNEVTQLTGWIPGWIIVLTNYGIVGVFLFLLSYLMLFLRSGKNSRFIILYFVIMGVGTELVADMYVLVLMPFVIKYLGNKTNITEYLDADRAY